ncbi:sulfite exporter TauE/SafE family protein [Marinobacter subterrani]|uniref:sulfite exporter TauE/SafE family protein n=1 Tax=Marinobacter subterrani TaxID=1658765 RepID=UPI002352BAF1|nr:sulfite exporter TauE/SafE family protein [Marinobacter subterrani]
MTQIYVFAVCLALGAVAGTVAGLFGIGGGLIIVPVLMFGFGLQGVNPEIIPHLAVGTSLATIVFTSLSSIRAHHRHNSVRWDLFRPMTVGIVGGALVGAWTASLMSGRSLELAIGIFVILVAVKMLLDANPKPGRKVPDAAGLGIAGGGIGWASAIFGIGGGTLTVPYLSWCNVRMQQAVGTSAACGLPIAVAGALGNIWTGWQNPALPALSFGFIYLPALAGIILTSVVFARVGANLAHRLNARVLKQIFSIMLLLVGLRFLLS